MAYCTECGTELVLNGRFCTGCGARRIDHESPATPAQATSTWVEPAVLAARSQRDMFRWVGGALVCILAAASLVLLPIGIYQSDTKANYVPMVVLFALLLGTGIASLLPSGGAFAGVPVVLMVVLTRGWADLLASARGQRVEEVVFFLVGTVGLVGAVLLLVSRLADWSPLWEGWRARGVLIRVVVGASAGLATELSYAFTRYSSSFGDTDFVWGRVQNETAGEVTVWLLGIVIVVAVATLTCMLRGAPGGAARLAFALFVGSRLATPVLFDGALSSVNFVWATSFAGAVVLAAFGIYDLANGWQRPPVDGDRVPAGDASRQSRPA